MSTAKEKAETPRELVERAIEALGKVQPGSARHTARWYLQQALEALA